MLTNYDAKAVADVMGIAFQECQGRGPAGAVKPARHAKAATSAEIGKFVITIDHDSVRIVEARTKRASGDLRNVRPASSVLIEKAVEKGLPRLALRSVAEQIAGTDKAKVASLEWGIVPKTTLERRAAQLSPLESERTERVARLFVHARSALGSEAEARAFMTTPHPQLDGRSPIDAAKTDLGTRRTEQILNALEYGLAL